MHVAQSIDGAGVVADLGQRHAVVEVGGVQQLVAAVARDPGFVEIGGFVRLFRLGQLVGCREQLDDRGVLHAGLSLSKNTNGETQCASAYNDLGIRR